MKLVSKLKTGNDYNKKSEKKLAWQIQKDKSQFTFSKGKIRYSLKQNAPLIHHFTKTFS
jgi:hypothetical protein